MKESTRELETVVSRMYAAGWPEPKVLCANGTDRVAARENWRRVVEGLAGMYLTSGALRVDTLISLGPLAKDHLADALDLAGWEGDAPMSIADAEPKVEAD